MTRIIHEEETARTIVSALKAALATMSNDRRGHPLHSYQKNTMAPGINYAIDLIERAFRLLPDREER
jgi:hypothetical protein